MIRKEHNMLEQLVGDSQALDRAIAGEELTYKDGLELMNYDNLHLLGAVADATRKKLVGDTVTFAASYYMNYTNVCAASCQMCASSITSSHSCPEHFPRTILFLISG